MECTISIPCGSLPFFKKFKINKIVYNDNYKSNYKYIPIFDNNIERN